MKQNNPQKKEGSSYHNEEIPCIQKVVKAEVKIDVSSVIQEAGDSFVKTSSNLLGLNTKLVLSDETVEAAYRQGKPIRRRQFPRSDEERLNDNSKSFCDSITGNNLVC